MFAIIILSVIGGLFSVSSTLSLNSVCGAKGSEIGLAVFEAMVGHWKMRDLDAGMDVGWKQDIWKRRAYRGWVKGRGRGRRGGRGEEVKTEESR